MKIYTVYFILFSVLSNLYAQWRPLNTFTENAWLNSVYFTDDEHGWIAGSNGTILKFDPVLFNWNKVSITTNEEFKSIGFFDNSTGFAAGSNGTLMMSNDGGNSWQNLPMGTTANLNKIFILDQNTGYISGETGFLIKTTNKGSTWLPISFPNSKNVTSVFFINDQTGFAGTDSTSVLRTTNGGLTWGEQDFISPDPLFISSIFFCDSLNGFLGGGLSNNRNIFKRTTDGGITWNDETVGNPSGNIRSFFFRDMNNGVVTGGDDTWNRFLQVKKDGQFKTVIFHSEDYDIMSVCITPSGAGWAVGGGSSIFYADDFKENWGQVYIGSEDFPQALASSRDDHLFLESKRNNFRDPGPVTLRGLKNNLLWKDVSQYWDQSGNNVTLGFCMIDSLSGFKIEEFARLYRTTDGGFSWENIPSPGEDQSRIYFLSETTGFIYQNNLFKTTDGGTTWNNIYTSPFKITDLIFVNSSTGYACGSDNSLNGKIIKTTNGGASWNELVIPETGHLTSVSFTNPDTGIVTGWGNAVLKTYNGGQTWMPVFPLQKPQVTETYFSKPVKAKNDKRYIINNNRAAGIFKVTEPASIGNFTDAVFKGSILFAGSDDGSILESTDYGNSWTTNQIGDPVLEIEYDGLHHAIARAIQNIFIMKLTPPVPVEFLSFTANYNNSAVLLEWSTATEMNNAGFDIEKNDGTSWSKIGFVEGKGNSTSKSYYRFTDINITPNRKIAYRIKQIDYSGEVSYISETDIFIDIKEYALDQNYPNPFNPSTKIKYTLPQKEYVKITVSDALGREVQVLENSEKESGIYEIIFDGASLSSGIYYYTIIAGDYSTTRKMIFLK